MRRRTKRILWGSVAGFLIFALAAGGWIWKTHAPMLKEVAKDLKAGAMARGAEHPFERYLELRYGSMSDPANRQKAFLGFFDRAHMEGMHRLVRYMKPEEKRKNIAASADWIANYRETMTPPEKEALAAWIGSDQGRASLQQATAAFRSREITYRAATEPVVKELMTTLATLREVSE